MGRIISFASLVVRDIVGVKAPEYGQWSWETTESEANAVAFDELVYNSRPARGDAADLEALEDAFVDEDKFLVGGSNQIRFREVFAVVSDAAFDSDDFRKGGAAEAASGTLYKLSDSAYGARASTLATENDSDDPVLIRSHGRLNNKEVGFLDGAGRLLGVGFDARSGFGVDDGPGSGARWIRNGSAIDFAATGEDALTGVRFVASVQGGGAVAIAFDTDGTTSRNGGSGESRFVTDSALTLGGFSEAGATLPGIADGDEIFVDLVRGEVTLTRAAGGAPMTVESPELAAAIAETDYGNLTIGAPAWQGRGFSIRDLALETAERLVLDFDDLTDLGPDREKKIPDGYGGFDWTQTGVFETGNFGLNYLASSERNVGFIAEASWFEVDEYADGNETRGAPARIARDEPFAFLSADFTPQGRDGMVVTVEGWRDGALVETEAVALGPLGSITEAQFDFAEIDELRFSADDGDPSSDDYFGFDDLAFLF